MSATREFVVCDNCGKTFVRRIARKTATEKSGVTAVHCSISCAAQARERLKREENAKQNLHTTGD